MQERSIESEGYERNNEGPEKQEEGHVRRKTLKHGKEIIKEKTEME